MMLAALGYLAGAAVLALLAYLVPRLLIREPVAGETHTLATSIVVRLGTLHALILALMFAQEMENYLGVIRLITNEAGAVADVYYDAKRYGDKQSARTEEIRQSIARYVHFVLEEEWRLLADRRLSDDAWRTYSAVDMALLRLEPEQEYERDLRSQMLNDWDQISEYRRARETAASREIPVSFWTLAVVGFLFVILPYSVFPPRAVNLALLCAYGAFNGLVFFFIFQLSNPFAGTAPIEPVAMQRLYAEDMRRLVDTADP